MESTTKEFNFEENYKKLKENGEYKSPRLTAEILDCGVPMTFDQYSVCSFNCAYCFSQFQKLVNNGMKNDDYINKLVKPVDIESVKKLFLNPDECGDSQASHNFKQFIKNKKMLQWGGLADPFDGFERKHRVGLELLKFFKEIQYPITFSTKSTWFLHDPEYLEVIKGTEKLWHFKVSIISYNEEKSKLIEMGVSSPKKRLENFKILSSMGNPCTLRFRPFIIGASDDGMEHLIKEAKENGAFSVSTEFLCLELRTAGFEYSKKNYERLNKAVGFDILEFYRQNSEGSGYLRLNFETKKPYIEKIVDLCKEHNLKLAVSDAHLKTYGEMGCCCGVPEDWNYFKGQLTEAIVNAKKCGGCFSWDDLGSDLRYYEDIKYEKSLLNKISMKHLAEYKDHSVADFLQEKWANPTDPNSPSGYTDKNIIPVKLNENENIVYKIKDTKK